MIYWQIAEHIFAACGGLSLLLHEGLPRSIDYLMGFVIDHPKGRAALVKWWPEIVQAMTIGQEEIQKNLDQSTPPA